MVIGFDIDDTITRHPPFFAAVTHALRAAGHRVVIVTMRVDRRGAERDLVAMGISWDELHTFDMDEPDYWGWKGRVCAAAAVEVFFDDSPDILCRLPATVFPMLAVEPRRHRLERISEADDEDAAAIWTSSRPGEEE